MVYDIWPRWLRMLDQKQNRKLGAKERCKCALNIVGLGLDIFYRIKLGKFKYFSGPNYGVLCYNSSISHPNS